jgi:hypothetical protein
LSKKSILLVVFVLVALTEVYSQSFYAIRHERDLIVSFGTGTSTYFGEMQNPKDYIDAKPSFNIGAQILPFPNLLQNRLNARAELTWFKLQGSDAEANDDRIERNLSFFSNNWELNAVGIFNLLPQDMKFYQRTFFNFYGFFGTGLLYINPKTNYQGEKVALQPLQTEGVKYSKLQFIVPYGFGLRFRNGPFYNISIEGGWRKTFTDYLDDASIRRYPDPATLSSDLSRALSDRRREIDPDYIVTPNSGVRGNPKNKDSYMLLNIKLEYYLPIDLRHNDHKLMTVKRKRYRNR